MSYSSIVSCFHRRFLKEDSPSSVNDLDKKLHTESARKVKKVPLKRPSASPVSSRLRSAHAHTDPNSDFISHDVTIPAKRQKMRKSVAHKAVHKNDHTVEQISSMNNQENNLHDSAPSNNTLNHSSCTDTLNGSTCDLTAKPVIGNSEPSRGYRYCSIM